MCPYPGVGNCIEQPFCHLSDCCWGDTALIRRGGWGMAKPAVILVGADKGGVGKTTVSRSLLDYFIAHNVPTRAFDTESPKGTLSRFHPDITDVVDVTSTADQMKIFETLAAT